jgi:hypothetical protein
MAIVAGVVGMALVAPNGDGDLPIAGSEQTRWDWIVANSTQFSEDLLLADPDGMPQPRFDYSGLGVEQRLLPVAPALVSIPDFIVPEAIPPVVHVGQIGRVEDGGPFDVFLVRSTHGTDEVVVCTPFLGPGGGGSGCHYDSEPSDGIVAGFTEGAGSVLARVDFWVPRDTAVLAVHMEDGQTFVQRPVVGVGAMLLDLDDSWIDYAEALDADGLVLLRDDFVVRPPIVESTPTTTGPPGVEVHDPVVDISGPTTFYSSTGEYVLEGWVDEPAQVTVGGIDATEHVDPGGRTSFWAELALGPGDHEIRVIAITDAGGDAVATMRLIVDPALEERFGYLVEIGSDDSTATVDTAEWLSGEEAVATARADGVIPADQDYIDGDYYIRNLVADASIFPLGAHPVIVLQACWPDDAGPCVAEEQVDLPTWQALIADPESGYDTVGWWWYGTDQLPYWFTIQDGVVVQVREHYLP